MCSDTWGDVGTLSLGELLDESVSVGRPNLLLKKGKSGVSAKVQKKRKDTLGPSAE